MRKNKWLKCFLIVFALLFVSTWAIQTDAWARAGGGSSMGSRGARSSSPPRPYTAPKPSQPSPSTTPQPITPPVSQPSSFMRTLGAGLLGGFLGSMLFRGLGFGGIAGPGLLGGISIIDILLMGGIGYLIYRFVRRRREETLYQTAAGSVQMPYQAPYPPVYDQQPQTQGDADLEAGLAHIKQYDPDFDEAKFQDHGMDTFFQIQGAWANRDMSGVRNLLTDEMFGLLQEDAQRLKHEGKINRLENIAVRSVDITEAWQESGTDFITVRIYANLLDYTVEESSGQVLEGSKTEPVKFEEYWTFTRPVGANPWQLSAIQQAP